MALSATFTANFSSFYDAVAKADVKLKDFGAGADKVGTRLNTLSNQFSGVKIVQEATIMAKAIEEIGGVSKLTEKELARVGSTAQEAVQKMKALGMDVPKNIQEIADKTKGANKATTDWLGTITKVASAVGIAFSVGAITNFIGSVFDAASAIKNAAASVGMGAEAFQRIKSAVEQGGGSMEAFTSAASKLNDNLAEGSNSTVAALKAIGLEFQTIRGMKPEDAFLAVSDAVGKIEDPMERARVAQDLFGKGAIALLPGMIEGYRDVAAGAAAMSDETIKSLAAAQDAWGKLADKVIIVTGTIIGNAMKQLEKDLAFQKDFWGSMGAFLEGGVGKQREYNAAMMAGRRAAEEKRQADARSREEQARLAEQTGRLTFRTQAQTEADKKAAEAAGKSAEATAKAAREAADALNIWNTRIDLVLEEERVTRQAQAAEVERRKGFFQSMGVIKNLNAVEQAAMTHNAAALVQRQAQIVSMEEWNAGLQHTAYLASVAAAEQDKLAHSSAGLGDLMGSLSKSVLSAIQGGGNLFQAAGSTIGNFILDPQQSGVGKAIEGAAKKLPGLIGGAISSAIPVVGSFIGPAIGWLSDKISGWFGKKEHEKLRESFIEAAGGIEPLRAAAEAAGLSLDNLMRARKTDDVKTAIADIEKSLTFQANAYDVAIKTAEKYGFTIEQLGPAMARQELDKKAQDLYKDWQVLNAAGIDTIHITDKMAESVNDYVQDALAMGTEIPEEMRPMLQSFAQAGKLLDAAGGEITDLEGHGLTFTMTMSQGFKELIGEVKLLTEAIARGLGLAIKNTPDIDIDANVTPKWVGPHTPKAEPEGYQKGTKGFKNFGTGTPVVLHGWEAVVPRDDAGAFATVHGAGSGTTAAAVAPVITINAQGAFFDTPGDLQRLADKVNDALTAKFGLRNAMRAG